MLRGVVRNQAKAAHPAPAARAANRQGGARCDRRGAQACRRLDRGSVFLPGDQR